MVAALKKPDLLLRKRPRAWWRVFLYVAYYLGTRRGEILGLTWDRILFDTLEVKVSAITSKGRKDRVVPMAPELANVLREWRATQGEFDPKAEVLPWPYPSYRQIYCDWHAIQAAAGIAEGEHYVPKNCRSSCASELIAAGVPTVVVKDFLGHATVATTEKYYINTKPALRAAALARKVKVS
jgi:integrase